MNQASPLYMLHAAKFLNLKPINLSGWYWYWQSLPFKSEGSRFSRLHISTIKTIWRRLLRQPRCLCLSQKNVSVERKIPEKATRKINQKKNQKDIIENNPRGSSCEHDADGDFKLQGTLFCMYTKPFLKLNLKSGYIIGLCYLIDSRQRFF